MKRGSLPIRWVRWRRRRYNSLTAQGLAGHLAWTLAKGEAAGRHRIARIVGNRAAEDAELACSEVGGSLRFFLVGDGVAAIEQLKSTVAGKPA